ncbi:MAG: hypothetical protein IH602_22400 [Bryobacteraceae bacterium]|nr:hypothetical protein [Bryobacteraceae bacterium]
MAREYFLRLAAGRHRAIVGTDLVLNQRDDAEDVRRDGAGLGRVVAESAARWKTPLAIPLMDLRLEKADLLAAYGMGEEQADRFHFETGPAKEVYAEGGFPERQRAQIGAIEWVAANTELMPVGMAIGPFSLMTKLLADPITPLAMALSGVTAEEDAGVAAVERCCRLAEAAVARSVKAQIEAGARAMIICEPAANIVFLSPRQLAKSEGAFARFVLEPNLRVRSLMDEAGVDLIFHNCGHLDDKMVRAFGHVIHPSVLSMGSSRKLWQDAALVPDDVVLFGNLPTRMFYSDADMPCELVASMTRELAGRMEETGHPHILGSECDVLHVEGASGTILKKVEILLAEGRE